jgi:protease IV
MGADLLVAQPATITGSIGVFGGKFSLRGLYDKIGISKEVLRRGKNSALFSEYSPWTTEERQQVRALMTAFYEDFVGKVAERRHKSYDEIHAVAQGRVWTGVEGQNHGLVDQLGGLDSALQAAKKRAGLDAAQEVDIVVLPESKGIWEVMTERQEELAEARLLPGDVRALLTWGLGVPQGPWARMPFEIRVR